MHSSRRDEILELLQRSGSMSVRELSELLYVSEPTIRRDLIALQEEKRIRRVRGGAELITGTADTPVPWSLRLHGHDRQRMDRMLKHAASLVKDGDVIMLDSSSTVYLMIPFLKEKKDLIVLTNSLYAASLLAQMSVKTYIAGGMIKDPSGASIGDEARRMLQRFHADLVFLSCAGISDDGKLTEYSVDENLIRLIMLEQSKRSVLLINDRCYHTCHMHTLCGIEKIDDVLTTAPLPAHLQKLRAYAGKRKEIY
ncbi:MAG: DeoR/GlpR transcriptional regulator [Oscillospiraceae bacterium]|nr:DeoR/GlpR transcriptional regulator [Oscillospiraceae bacterium]